MIHFYQHMVTHLLRNQSHVFLLIMNDQEGFFFFFPDAAPMTSDLPFTGSLSVITGPHKQHLNALHSQDVASFISWQHINTDNRLRGDRSDYKHRLFLYCCNEGQALITTKCKHPPSQLWRWKSVENMTVCLSVCQWWKNHSNTSMMLKCDEKDYLHLIIEKKLAIKWVQFISI